MSQMLDQFDKENEQYQKEFHEFYFQHPNKKIIINFSYSFKNIQQTIPVKFIRSIKYNLISCCSINLASKKQ